MTMIDGSSALQPTEPQQPISEERLIHIVRDVVNQAIEPIHLDIANLRNAIRESARRDEVLTPGQVDERIHQSEERMVARLENISAGFQSTVKEVQRVWEAHAEESLEYRKSADKKHEAQNSNIIELRRDLMSAQQTWMQSTDNLRGEVQVVAAQVQVNESQASTNRAYISDIDARGQQLEKGYTEIKQDVKSLSADVRAGQSHINAKIESNHKELQGEVENIRSTVSKYQDLAIRALMIAVGVLSGIEITGLL